MLIEHADQTRLFYISPSSMSIKDVPKVQDAGFDWYGAEKLWISSDKYKATNLFITHNCQLNDMAFTTIMNIIKKEKLSRAERTNTKIIAPKDQKYLPYQSAGIEALCDRFNAGFKAALLADPMGLGKTIEACGVINHNMYDPERVLVVCPASLRINWQRELDKWLVWNGGNCKSLPILPGSSLTKSVRKGPLVISYEATLDKQWFNAIISQSWDLVIFDESQYLKNPEAQRTQNCLTPGGIADRADSVLSLSGTPIPNWPHEFYSSLSALAPDVINGMTEDKFTTRYTEGFNGAYGLQITGGRNHSELNCKLRGSGYMIRREKRKVLPQLPPERPNLIIFPQSTGTAEVIRKEQENEQFSASEILKAGKPLGYGAFPELRKEMGIEKLPDSIGWIRDQMDGGLSKVVVFAYHQEVLEGLYAGLEKYKPMLVYGPTTMSQRQTAVDTFQLEPDCQMIIGGWKPLGVGWNLTAADTVVMVESSFNPSDNRQCVDRLIRYGQKAKGINVYHLVVEGSIDATVMAKAALKQYNIDKVMI